MQTQQQQQHPSASLPEYTKHPICNALQRLRAVSYRVVCLECASRCRQGVTIWYWPHAPDRYNNQYKIKPPEWLACTTSFAVRRTHHHSAETRGSLIRKSHLGIGCGCVSVDPKRSRSAETVRIETVIALFLSTMSRKPTVQMLRASHPEQ